MESKPNLLHPSKAGLNIAVENDSDEEAADAAAPEETIQQPSEQPAELASAEPTIAEAPEVPVIEAHETPGAEEPEAPGNEAPISEFAEPVENLQVEELAKAEAAVEIETPEVLTAAEPAEPALSEVPAEAAAVAEPAQHTSIEDSAGAMLVKRAFHPIDQEDKENHGASDLSKDESSKVTEPPVESFDEYTPDVELEEPKEAEPIQPPGIEHALPPSRISLVAPPTLEHEQPPKKSKASISSERKLSKPEHTDKKSKASIASKTSQGSRGSQDSNGSHSKDSKSDHGSRKSSSASTHSKKSVDHTPKKASVVSQNKSTKSDHKNSSASVNSRNKSKASVSSKKSSGSKKSTGSTASKRMSAPADELPTLVEDQETDFHSLHANPETEASQSENPMAELHRRSKPSKSRGSTASGMSSEQLQLARDHHSGSLEKAASHMFVDTVINKKSTMNIRHKKDDDSESTSLSSEYTDSEWTMGSESFAASSQPPSRASAEVVHLHEDLHLDLSVTPAAVYTPAPLPLSLCHTPVSSEDSQVSFVVSKIDVIDLGSEPSPYQRDPTDDEKCAFTRSYGRIFNALNLTDLKAARQVCFIWHLYSGDAFKKKSCFVFDPEDLPLVSTVTDCLSKIMDNPWIILAPQKSSQFLTFLETSEKKLKPWNSLRINSATSTDIKFLIEDKQMEVDLRRAVKSITSLELNTCFIDWETLFRFLHCFSHLEEFIDIHNVYYEPIPFHVQIYRTLSGGTISPRTHHEQMDQTFIQKFKKYRFRWKRLKIQDTGMSTNTPQFMLCLKEALVPGALQELELIAGGECTSCVNKNDRESLHFWLATGELLFHSGNSLKKLTIRCTHETAATTSFDSFVNSSLEYLNQSTNGNMQILAHLTLDFSFLWLSDAHVEKEFVPFITKLELLKSLTLKTIVMRPIYGERLEALKPLLSTCHYNFGVHVTDLEGGAAVPYVIRLVESSMYRINMRSLHMSIHSPQTIRFQQLMTEQDEIQYTGLQFLNISIMNRSFIDMNITLLPAKFPNLTELTITDGPPVYYLVGQHGLVAEKQYDRMSKLVFVNDDLQYLVAHYPKLQVLSLQLNMEAITDTGMTGITEASIKRMAFLRDMKLQEPEYEITGYCMGDLPDLRSLVLKGLGPWVTDITAKLAFVYMKNLKTLVLGGKQRISRDGKAHLISQFPKDKGYTLKILG